MTTELEKMLAGELYDPRDPELVRRRGRARDLCQILNATREGDEDARRRVLRELLGKGGDTVWIQPPFYCDYGERRALGSTEPRKLGWASLAPARRHGRSLDFAAPSAWPR